jgi:transaldolase
MQPPLLQMTKTTPTVLWNDSADPAELTAALTWGCVGATCNPVIAYNTIRRHPDLWVPRIREIAERQPTAGEAQIGWQAVKDMTVEAAKLLEPAFEKYHGRNGRISVQTDPRLHRNRDGLLTQALEFDALAKNIIVKIPATKTGIEAMEQATYRAVSINATVSFTVAQAVAVGEAIERGLVRREAEGLDASWMGPVVTIMGGRLDDWLKKGRRTRRDHHRPRLSRMGRGRSPQTRLPRLPAARLPKPHPLCRIPQPPAVERACRWRSGGLPTVLVAAEVQQQRHQPPLTDRRTCRPPDHRLAVSKDSGL